MLEDRSCGSQRRSATTTRGLEQKVEIVIQSLVEDPAPSQGRLVREVNVRDPSMGDRPEHVDEIQLDLPESIDLADEGLRKPVVEPDEFTQVASRRRCIAVSRHGAEA